MRISAIAAAAVVGIAATVCTTIDADARRGGSSGASGHAAVRTVHRSVPMHRSRASSRHTLHREVHEKHHTSGKKELSADRLRDRRTLRGLPISKAVAGDALRNSKLAVPQGLHPKLTLTHKPPSKYFVRFTPFVQRFWRRPFFWVAIAGIGYLTVPEFYWDDFYRCIGVDDPLYDDCIYILSYAALDEADVVRVSMPPNAVYRYRATAAATEDCRACRWDRFVERKWKQSFGWVKVPEIGDVTVPDAYYDRFHAFAASNPPDYPHACRVLEDAAAAEGDAEITRSSMSPGSEYRFQVDGAPGRECTSCTLAPFVDRKWNSAYVWVQVPQAGNITVPEDAYDRFYRYASAEPPNYAAACKVLTEAAAADTVMTSSLDDTRGME